MKFQIFKLKKIPQRMKKLILFAFSILFVSALTARPVPIQQMLMDSKYMLGTDTLEIYDTLGNKINNSTIRIYSSDPDVDAIISYVWLKNTTSTEMPNVFVRRIVNQSVESTDNSFCFGIQCYPPFVDESTVADTAKVGILNKSFTGDYYPYTHSGITSITYEFFDNLTFMDAPVSAKVTFEYYLSANSINEDKMVFKGPYPNPASQYAHFEYNLPTSASVSQLIIRNMLGVEIENMKFEGRSGKKALDVSSYPSGIYFYTYVVDGKVIQSRKLIVKH
jgi:hypothetical protein